MVPNYGDSDSSDSGTTETFTKKSTGCSRTAIEKGTKEDTKLTNGKCTNHFKPRQVIINTISIANGVNCASKTVKMTNTVKENGSSSGSSKSLSSGVFVDTSSNGKKTKAIAVVVDSCDNLSSSEGGSYTNGIGLHKKREGWLVSEASNHACSETSSNTSSSSSKSSHKFIVRNKDESETTSERISTKKENSCSSSQDKSGWKVVTKNKAVLEKSLSEDCCVGGSVDTCDNKSLQSCQSEEVAKAPQRKGLMSFLSCLSGAQSPAVSPDEQKRSFVPTRSTDAQNDSITKRLREEELRENTSKKHRQEYLKNGNQSSNKQSSTSNSDINRDCNPSTTKLNRVNGDSSIENNKVNGDKSNLKQNGNIHEENFSLGESERRHETINLCISNGHKNSASGDISDSSERTNNNISSSSNNSSNGVVNNTCVTRAAPNTTVLEWDRHSRGDLAYTLSSHKNKMGGAAPARASQAQPIWTAAADDSHSDTVVALQSSSSYAFGAKGKNI